jgi:hypothetical protein
VLSGHVSCILRLTVKEIRIKIWQASFRPRVVALDALLNPSFFLFHFSKSSRHPTALRVNRESRAEALAQYSILYREDGTPRVFFSLARDSLWIPFHTQSDRSREQRYLELAERNKDVYGRINRLLVHETTVFTSASTLRAKFHRLIKIDQDPTMKRGSEVLWAFKNVHVVTFEVQIADQSKTSSNLGFLDKMRAHYELLRSKQAYRYVRMPDLFRVVRLDGSVVAEIRGDDVGRPPGWTFNDQDWKSEWYITEK